MEMASIKGGSRADLMVRIAYVAIVAGLALFAMLTYRELQRQRSAPVILPPYSFYTVNYPEKGSIVKAFGTWYAVDGPALAENLQTTTIECTKTLQQCMESTAIVSVGEKGFLDAAFTAFDVEHWTDEEIVTKQNKGKCTTRIIRMDLVARRATSVIAAIPDAAACAEQPRNLKLEGGSKARTDALGKSK